MEYAFAIIAAAAIVWIIILLRERATLSAENSRLQERLTIISEQQPQQRQAEEDRFRNIASEIFDRNSRMLDERHSERLTSLLDPLKRDIESFRKSVTECYDTEMRERHSLRDRIRELVDESRVIGREAKDLTLTLRGGGRVQGDWGEMLLESILEKSGLRRGEEFRLQQTAVNDEGRTLRPDAVVYYPDGRCLVIDSKVSLTAFLELTESTDAERTAALGRRHVQSVRNHISELRRKNYQDFTGCASTDFVLMFIPNEPAYIEAMRIDPTLWQEACDQRVLIVSPTHLVATLKLVEQLWRQDRQTRHALEIATEAGKMYDKFVGFTTDMETLGKGLERARKAFDDAMGKLSTGRGNLTDRARALRELGAKASKSLPGNQEQPDGQA